MNDVVGQVDFHKNGILFGSSKEKEEERCNNYKIWCSSVRASNAFVYNCVMKFMCCIGVSIGVFLGAISILE